MHIPRRLLLVVFLTGCAYGYAGQESKVRTEPEEEQDVEVVKLEEEDSEPTTEPDDTETGEETVEPDEPASPCGVDTFDIHLYTATSQVTKTINCTDRRVVNVQRTPIGETGYQDAKTANLPENEWYLLVDPRGIRSKYLDNDALLKLSREFTIDYYGRDSAHDLLVYIYEDEVE